MRQRMTPTRMPTTTTTEETRRTLVAERASAFALILCGLPGAGKTTFAKALVERAKREGLDAFHACFDAYERRRRNDENDDEDEDAFDREAWRAARVDAMDAATAVVENATNANGTLVVVDDNMYYEGMRWRAFRRMREARASCATAYVKAGGVGERGDGEATARRWRRNGIKAEMPRMSYARTSLNACEASLNHRN
jgi:predicted kinase